MRHLIVARTIQRRTGGQRDRVAGDCAPCIGDHRIGNADRVGDGNITSVFHRKIKGQHIANCVKDRPTCRQGFDKRQAGVGSDGQHRRVIDQISVGIIAIVRFIGYGDPDRRVSRGGGGIGNTTRVDVGLDQHITGGIGGHFAPQQRARNRALAGTGKHRPTGQRQHRIIRPGQGIRRDGHPGEFDIPIIGDGDTVSHCAADRGRGRGQHLDRIQRWRPGNRHNGRIATCTRAVVGHIRHAHIAGRLRCRRGRIAKSACVQIGLGQNITQRINPGLPDFDRANHTCITPVIDRSWLNRCIYPIRPLHRIGQRHSVQRHIAGIGDGDLVDDGIAHVERGQSPYGLDHL